MTNLNSNLDKSLVEMCFLYLEDIKFAAKHLFDDDERTIAVLLNNLYPEYNAEQIKEKLEEMASFLHRFHSLAADINGEGWGDIDEWIAENEWV